MGEIDELQVKLAFLEGQLGSLDEVVRELGDELSRLARVVRSLESRLDAEGEPEGLDGQRPPHYDKL